MVAHLQARLTKRERLACGLGISVMTAIAASPAFAQIEKLTSVLDNVKTVDFR